MKGKYPCNPILIVDDEINNLNSVEMALNMEKITNIVTCNDSRLVEQLLTIQQFSIVLLDLSIVFVSGEQILQLMNDLYSDVPVVIFTGKKNIEYHIRNKKSNVWYYLSKPVSLIRLVSSVKWILELSNY